ncbi:unnamed protein product [Acanthoscelides obtectus]|uniref:Zinc finger BED domain-containing protein 4 n=1 Tax=Acanthoscelides obtectus TaxID=200917 RepID=A0A9P0PSX2_ACAOB|nr:unnamed protein product [Acanthoscelides obtectus]CAK1654636.1 Zinc finger BED domain-containing protein 4 [Acanthoscelides obtectus]
MACAMRTGHYESLGCVSHTLQLVIKQSLFADEDTTEIIKKCRKIVGHFHHSEPATRKLKECQIQCGLPEHALVQSIDIRWNSTYLMFQRLLEQKNAINLYTVQHGKIDTLCPTKWKIMKRLIEVLKFFYEATLDLSLNDACISIIIPLISLLNRKLQARMENEDEGMTMTKNRLYETMNQRMSLLKEHPSLIAATLLDPRFKSKYLTPNAVDIGITEIVSFLIRCSSDSAVNRNAIHSSSSAEPVLVESNIQKQDESLWDTHDDNPGGSPCDNNGYDGTSILKQTIECRSRDYSGMPTYFLIGTSAPTRR